MTVLVGAKEYNLKLNKQKCEVQKTELTYVGHRLTSEGVRADHEKIRAVVEMTN